MLSLTPSLQSAKDIYIYFYGVSRCFCCPEGATFSRRSPRKSVARYAKHNANFVLVVSGSLKAKRTKEFIEIVYDLLIKAIELGSFALLEFGVRPVGLK